MATSLRILRRYVRNGGEAFTTPEELVTETLVELGCDDVPRVGNYIRLEDAAQGTVKSYRVIHVDYPFTNDPGVIVGPGGVKVPARLAGPPVWRQKPVEVIVVDSMPI